MESQQFRRTLCKRIGFAGNILLLVCTEWFYLHQNWGLIFDYSLQATIFTSVISNPLFWIFIIISFLFYPLTVSGKVRTKNNEEGSISETIIELLVSPIATGSTQHQTNQDSSLQRRAQRTEDSVENRKTDLIKWAIQSDQEIEFSYEDRDGNKSHRVVKPTGFKNIGESLCLEGYCRLRRSKRVFSVLRISGLQILSSDNARDNRLNSETEIQDRQSPSRPYVQHSTSELEAIVNSAWNSLDQLEILRHELSFRQRRNAQVLQNRVSQRIDLLSGQRFEWPTTTVNPGFQPMSSDVFRNREGLLSQYGYKVGEEGLSQYERLAILDSIFLNPITGIDNPVYLSEWGEPQSSARLKKLANSIAAFTRNSRRRNDKDFSQAIQDWEDDLNYLKRRYYDQRFSFRWPRT